MSTPGSPAAPGAQDTPPDLYQPHAGAILDALRVLWEPGQVGEVRALKVPSGRGYTKTLHGYFTDMSKAARLIASQLEEAEGVYFTLNPVQPELLARAANRLVVAESGSSTGDDNILSRRWLLGDLDPRRPSGISSTNQEHALALDKAREIRAALSAEGWPEPVFADSGNGGHLLYRIDLPNDDASRDLLQRVLEALAFCFGDERVSVDESVFNASRIVKAYGTWARKGDNIPERPWRLSRILDRPRSLAVVSREQLEAVAVRAPREPPAEDRKNGTPRGNFDLDAWMREHIPEARGPRPWKHGGTRWVIQVCPFNAEHSRGQAFVVRWPSGVIGAGCQDDTCRWGWRELREKFDPKARRASKKGKSAKKGAGKTDGEKEEGEEGEPKTLGELAEQGPVATSSDSSKIRVEFPYWTEALDEMTHKAWGVIGQANAPPFLFRTGSAPVRIEFEDDGSPFLRPVSDDRLRHALMQVGEWYRWKQDEDGGWEWKRTPLPAQLINNMLACPEIPLPLLLGVVEAPVFSADGQLQTAPGYSPVTKTFFDNSSGIVVPDVSEHPSQVELAQARRLLLEEVLGDFPFIGDAEKAHAVAMFILPLARELITGPTPLHLIEKPSPGTGATLLAELPGLVFTGRSTSAMTEGRDEDEWRKRLFAKLRKGPSIIFVDNLRRRLDSAAFSSAVTAWPFWEDRILGVSETLRVPVRAMWIASGNNPAVSSEISRRTVRIRLDAKIDRPWLRKDFRHKDLRSWVKANRGQLVWACLTLVRAWIVAGRPRGSQILGMFEGWAGVMGGIFQVSGIPGFLRNLAEFYEASDEEGAAGRMFLSSWWEKHQDRGVGVKDLLQIAMEVEGLDLGEGNELSQRTRLGKLLSRMRERIFTVDLDEGPRSLRLTHGGTVMGPGLKRAPVPG